MTKNALDMHAELKMGLHPMEVQEQNPMNNALCKHRTTKPQRSNNVSNDIQNPERNISLPFFTVKVVWAFL